MITIKRFLFESEIFYYNQMYYWNPTTTALGKPNLETDILTVEIHNSTIESKTDLNVQLQKPSKVFYSLIKNPLV